MKKKIYGIIVCTLLIATTVLPVTISMNDEAKSDQTENKSPVFLPKFILKWVNGDWDFWTKNPDIYLIPNGKVGIGTTSPTEKLDVVGTIQTTGFKIPTNAVDGYVLTSDANGVASWQPGVGAGDITAVNSGIGLTGGGNAGDVTLDVDFAGSGTLDTAARSDHNHDNDYVNEDDLDHLDAADGSPTNAVYVDNGGKVGIGTNTPTSMLEVTGVIYSTTGGFKFPDGTIQTSAATGGPSSGNTLDQAYDEGGQGAGRIITADSGPVSIGGVDGLVVAGDVGIGTNSPTSKLDVEVSGGGAATIGSPYNTAVGDFSIALGYATTASGDYSTAMGWHSEANGEYSTAIGTSTRANGYGSIAMGLGTVAHEYVSTAMGQWTNASNLFSTAMGLESKASGYASTAIGVNTTASGGTSIATGYNTIASGDDSFTTGFNTVASGVDSIAMGYNTVASGGTSLAFGHSSQATASSAVAMGYSNIASGVGSTALGYANTASGECSTALGRWTLASQPNAVAMGFQTKATGIDSTAMGAATNASGDYSTAMGYETKASGLYSNAIGKSSEASDFCSFASGYGTQASGYAATALGDITTASGFYSTAMGEGTVASNAASTAMGWYTTAAGKYSTAIGRYMDVTGEGSVGIGLNNYPAGWLISDDNVMSIMGGNVGINVTNPTHTLTIASHDENTLRLIGPYSPSIDYGARINFGDSNFAYIQEDEDDKLKIHSRLRTAFTGGNVGIGTEFPEEKLHVANGNIKTQADYGYILEHNNGYNSEIASRGDDQLWISNEAGGPIDFLTGTTPGNVNSKMTIYPSGTIHLWGNVGIKTYNPAYELDVEGDIQAKAYHTGDIYFQKDGQELWRMYEDENGLYLESLLNGKHYRLVLDDLEDSETLQQRVTELENNIENLEARIAALEILLH